MSFLENLQIRQAELEALKAGLEGIAAEFNAAGSYPEFYSEEYAAKMAAIESELLQTARQTESYEKHQALENDPERLALVAEVEKFMGKPLPTQYPKERLERFKVLIDDKVLADDKKKLLIDNA